MKRQDNGFSMMDMRRERIDQSRERREADKLRREKIEARKRNAKAVLDECGEKGAVEFKMPTYGPQAASFYGPDHIDQMQAEWAETCRDIMELAKRQRQHYFEWNTDWLQRGVFLVGIRKQQAA